MNTQYMQTSLSNYIIIGLLTLLTYAMPIFMIAAVCAVLIYGFKLFVSNPESGRAKKDFTIAAIFLAFFILLKPLIDFVIRDLSI